MQDPELPSVVRSRFERAGWYEGRREPLERALDPDHPAAALLAAFAGLELRVPPGETVLRFAQLLPGHADATWSRLLGSELVGIADLAGGHGALLVDREERVYGLSLVHDAAWFAGESFAIAIERIVRGEHGRPMLRPDQREVMLYGVTYRRGDAALHPWRE
jgi:hypothetical protein